MKISAFIMYGSLIVAFGIFFWLLDNLLTSITDEFSPGGVWWMILHAGWTFIPIFMLIVLTAYFLISLRRR